jgi:Ca-activated chloride channel homolog
VERAQKWVDKLEATGGTAIHDALAAALALRSSEEGRSFTIVFFTDGQPTIGETDPEKILKSFAQKNSSNTRVFTFGVGDDVNAAMLDALADQTRAVSTYVRPEEDIAEKTSALWAKASRPVLTDLRLSATNVRLSEVYPAALPDLFHGGQLVVLGRYSGSGPAAVRLTGKVGVEEREFVYELTFPDRTGDARDFVEQLWARRKVGYLLDQVRVNGEKKELIDEVVALAKKYGITTPYTSYLIVPDSAVPVAGAGAGGGRPNVSFDRPGMPGTPAATPPALRAPAGASGPVPVADFARGTTAKPDELGAKRGAMAEDELRKAGGDKKEGDKDVFYFRALEQKQTLERARELLRRSERDGVQTGKLGVDLALQMKDLRSQARLQRSALRTVLGRTCLEVGGVWIDEGFDAKTPTLVVKAQSDAYFRILERHPEVKDVFRLGNHLVWVTPSGTALVIDAKNGKDKLSDEEIDKLFAAKQK